MNGLTKRQAEILAFVRQFIADNGYSPSLHEIKDRFGFASANASAKHLSCLKRKGFLFTKAHTSRSISLPVKSEGGSAGLALPLIGTISSGKPIDIFAKIEMIHVTALNVAFPELIYLLKVQDNSLQEEMLLQEDLLIVEANSNPKPGDTVIATVNERNALVAKYFCDGDRVQLMSLTARHQPISLARKDVSVQGILISLLRNYSMPVHSVLV